MNNLQKMRAAQDTIYEIKKSCSAVSMEFKNAYAEKQDSLRHDMTLSPHGKMQKIEEFKVQQGKEFIARAAKMRTEYDRAAVELQDAAEAYLNEPANKPSEQAVQTYERKLTDFQTALLLATNPDKAMQLVKEFAADTQDPYFAAKLKADFPTIIREVTSIAGVKAPIYKTYLSSVLDSINHTATSGGYHEVQQVLDAGSLVGNNIWLPGGVQMSTIQQFVGGQYAKYSNNPADFRDEE